MPRPSSSRADAFDYVIVGGGSAGCVLANRLSADPAIRVLLLEAGRPEGGLMMAMPAGVYAVYGRPDLNWGYASEPEPNLRGRRIDVPRGKVLGGSSSINAMVYLRGHPRDYDGWAEAGLPDWSYRHCLPYFRRSESSDKGPSLYRGADGPLGVASGRLHSPIFDAFLAAAAPAGLGVSEDLNGAVPEGLGRMDSTKRRGRRASAARAYLAPAQRRPNLAVRTGVHVTRIRTEGRTATGVVFDTGRGSEIVTATRETILAAGAINSPQLLMLSGIGEPDALRALGIPVVHAAPEVGRNLQDHLNVELKFRCAEPVSLAWLGHPLAKAWVGARWLTTRSGPAASNIWEVGGLVRSGPEVDRPNLQFHLGPMLINQTAAGFRLDHGFSLHVAQLRQESRGSVRLRSSDSRATPEIRFNFLSIAGDLRELRDGVRLTRDLVSRRPLADLVSQEVRPGPSVRSDADIDDFLRAALNTEFHPSCTCRMGVDDGAVVDADLRVRGMERLRVVDASVMPSIVSANLNATVIMLAEKAADMILGREPLPPAVL